MNSVAFTMSLSKLAAMIASNYEVRWRGIDNQTRSKMANVALLRPFSTTSGPIFKCQNKIRKLHYQIKETHLPYFIRTNPWLKELRFSPGVNVTNNGNFAINNKTLYELCQHNVIVH